jgi:hypothetical protein
MTHARARLGSGLVRPMIPDGGQAGRDPACIDL